MSLPLLIVGGSPAARRAEVDLTPEPDRLVIQPEKTSGINAVRRLIQFLQRRPYSRPVKTAIIDAADKLTLPAQQALLKILEEPPARSRIILLCPSESRLLPTLVSRCLVRRLPETSQTPGLIAPPSAEAAETIETARAFVINQLYCLQSELRQRPETVNLQLIRALLLAERALTANVNPKLTLAVLALSYQR
jgi:hypothetical protein